MGQGLAAGAAALMTLILWIKHKENIDRLRAGTEGRIGQKS
jgi:glycerol-3-phosphate acyltransferase PlsY